MSRLSDEVSLKDYLFDFHKSIGAIVLGLLFLRIFQLLQVFGRRYVQRRPKLTKHWLQMVALHALLYGFILIVPLSGFFYSNSGGHDVAIFGLVLPDLFPENQAIFDLAHSIHFWLAYTFLAFIGLHVLEQRRFVRNIWRRLRVKYTTT